LHKSEVCRQFVSTIESRSHLSFVESRGDTDRLYTFLTRIDDQAFRKQIERWAAVTARWDGPQPDGFLAALPGDEANPSLVNIPKPDEPT
jgi:hypothetical protein